MELLYTEDPSRGRQSPLSGRFLTESCPHAGPRTHEKPQEIRTAGNFTWTDLIITDCNHLMPLKQHNIYSGLFNRGGTNE